MKSIAKATEFLRKAVGALRGKAAVLRARLLFLASLRRRRAVVAGISRHIRALAPRQEGKKQGREKAAAENADDDGKIEHAGGVSLPELVRLFELVANNEDGGGDGGYTDDWALTLRSLFDDDEDNEHRAGGLAVADDDDGDDERSVIDVIRSRREGDGQEFRIEDEIDQAAEMYITRVRRRIMNAHTEPGAIE